MQRPARGVWSATQSLPGLLNGCLVSHPSQTPGNSDNYDKSELINLAYLPAARAEMMPYITALARKMLPPGHALLQEM